MSNTVKQTVDFYKENIGAVLNVAPNKKGVTVQNWTQYNSKNQYPYLNYSDTSNYTVVLDQKIVAVDVDLKNIPDEVLKKKYENELRNHPTFKDTFTNRTPSGGYHFYFKLNTKTKLKGKTGAGHNAIASFENFPDLKIIDLPLNVLIPPSQIDGKAYTTINWAPIKKINSIYDLPLSIHNHADKIASCLAEINNVLGLGQHRGFVPEGNRNNTIYSLFNTMAKYGIPKDSAKEIFNRRFHDKFEGAINPTELEATFNSAYKLTSHKKAINELPKEILVKNYLEENSIVFRADILKQTKNFKENGGHWQDLDDYFVGKIAMDMCEEMEKGNFKEAIYTYIDSECNENRYHAGREFVKNHPRQIEDHLQTLIDNIETDINKDMFYWNLNENMIDGSKPNHTCLIFQGKQGVGKTGLCRLIVPEALKNYMHLGDFTTERDHTTVVSTYCFIIMDDIDTMDFANQKGLKSIITKAETSGRPAYGRYNITKKAVANFLATTNQREVLTDETGNRRYFPVQIKSINWEKINQELIENVWGQILSDYDNNKISEIKNEVRKYKNESSEQLKKFEKDAGSEETFLQHFSGVEKDEYILPILITTSQIRDIFLNLYPHREKKEFSIFHVNKAFTKMEIEDKRTKKIRGKVIYINPGDTSEVTQALKMYNEYNNGVGKAPIFERGKISNTDIIDDNGYEIEDKVPF